MARNTQENAEKTRSKILDSAKRLFAEKGYSATTIADICNRSGYTKGALFHHFNSKEALFEKIWTGMEVAMDQAATLEVIRVAEISNDAYEAFLAGCRVFLDHAVQPDFQQIIHIDGPAVLGMREWMKRDAGMGMRNLDSGLKYLASQGLIDEAKRKAFTILIYGALQGMAKSLSFPENSGGVSSEDMFKAFEDLVRNAHKTP